MYQQCCKQRSNSSILWVNPIFDDSIKNRIDMQYLIMIISKFNNIANLNNFIIEKMMNSQTKLHQWSHLSERIKQNNKKQACATLLQEIESFLSEGCRRDESNKYLLGFIKDAVSPCLFRSLLLLSLENIMGKGSSTQGELMELVTGLVDQTQRKEIRYELGVILLKSKGQLMKKMIDSCRSSESHTQSLLSLVSFVILNGIQKDSINNYNFTNVVFLASQSILAHSKLATSTISEAIRLLLIVDIVQKEQVMKMIVSSEILLTAVYDMIQQEKMSGYVYYLMGKLLLQGGDKEKIQQICRLLSKKIEQKIDAAAELNGQIDKIRFSDNKNQEKVDLIQKIRGICYFISQYVSNQLRQGTISDKWVKMIQALLQVKDFQCFEHLLPAFVTLMEAEAISTSLTQSIIYAIQSNCLPLRFQKVQHEDDSSSLDLRFYAQQFCPSPHTLITAKAAPLMLKLTELMMQSRGCKHKRTICGCCEQYIHTAIEKQYQLDFNPHEFMSACHLMCRQISRISSIGVSAQELGTLKDYLINNLKWLLNLNESCLPQYRKWINFKVFDLLLVFPPFFENNQFLREVVDELLIGRLPQTITHLEELIGFYQKQKKEKELLHLREKLLKKLSGQGLVLRDRVRIWTLMVDRIQNDRLKEYIEIQTELDESQFARFMVFSSRKLGGLEILQHKAEEIKAKWEASPSIFEEELQYYRKFRQFH